MRGSDFKNSKWCKEGATEKGRAKVGNGFKAWTSRVGNYGLLAKARQLYEFFLSPKVDGTQKAIVVGALLYLISPLDLIPDFIPVVGWLDDLGVAAFALNYIFATLGRIDSAEAEATDIPTDFKLSEQQVLDAEIVDENKSVAFKLKDEPQTKNPSVALQKRFAEIADVARTLEVEGSDVMCDRFEQMLFDTRLFQIAVAGRYATGKSTLLNALLSKNVLPSKPVPTTKAVTYLMRGVRCSIGAEYEDGAMRLESDVGEDDILGVYNDMTADKAKAVAIELPDFPFEDLALIDTPGIEDPDKRIAQKTVELMRNCDAIVVLIDANYPQSEAEYEFIEFLVSADPNRKLFIVLNKCDGKSPEERNSIKAKCLDELKQRNVIGVNVHAISATELGDGFAEFRNALFAYLRSDIRSEVIARVGSELGKYARSLRASCVSLLEAAKEEAKDREERERCLTEKRRQVSVGFDRQAATLSAKIDSCKVQMRSELANFIGGLKSEVRSAVNASDFATLKNSDAIAFEVNKKIKAFVDGQLASLGELVAKEFSASEEALRDEMYNVRIPLPEPTNDPSGLAHSFFPVTLAASYLLFGISTAFIGTLVFAVLGRKFFEDAIRNTLETFGLANARTRIADDVSAKLDDCEKRIWLRVSECVESIREKALSEFEARRIECMSAYAPTAPRIGLTAETVKDCRARLDRILGV